jgi:hypothetical protein
MSAGFRGNIFSRQRKNVGENTSKPKIAPTIFLCLFSFLDDGFEHAMKGKTGTLANICSPIDRLKKLFMTQAAGEFHVL